LIVGAYANGNFSGKSYVVFGKNTNSTVNLSDIAANLGGFSIKGEYAGDNSGYSVSGGPQNMKIHELTTKHEHSRVDNKT
jgi:hypothetical protein